MPANRAHSFGGGLRKLRKHQPERRDEHVERCRQRQRRRRVKTEFSRRPEHHLSHPERGMRSFDNWCELRKELTVGHAGRLAEPMRNPRRANRRSRPQAVHASRPAGNGSGDAA